MASQFVNWIKSPQGRAYFFSTHFWGPVANWGLPLAALADMQKDESLISGVMSPTMAGYSSIFMAFAWQVQPRNYLLFACHATNAAAQTVQTGRFVNYWYMGGKEKRGDEVVDNAESAVLSAVKDAESKASSASIELQKKLEQAKAHAAAGGDDAVRRGNELAEEAKREYALATSYLKDVKNVAAAEGEDALRRTKEIAEEAKREVSQAASFVAGKLGAAEDKVEVEAKKAEKKGWALWGSAKAKTETEVEAAKAHTAAGVQEVKKEAADAKDYIPEVKVEAKAKKGWFA